MTFDRSTMLAWSRSRRRSRKRYFSRMSSGILGLARDRQRQLVGARLDGDFARAKLDLAGRHLRVDRFGRARDDLAGHRDDAFGAQPVEHVERAAAGIGDDLGQAVMIAQVDEQHPAVIALAVDPARQARRGAGVAAAKVGAGMGAVGVHGGPFGR